MLLAMNAPINVSENGLKIEISPLTKPLKPLNIVIPNDPSSAFYFALAGALLPNSRVVLKNVLLNKTRIEAFKVLEKMGARIEFKQIHNDFESVGEICVQSSHLRAVSVSENISWLIDEAPALAIAFACAEGVSRLTNAKELRVKESDRISAVVQNLQRCGIKAKELDDGFEIQGGVAKRAKIQSFGDHRIAMSFAILGLKCGMDIDECECINTSFPNFLSLLESLGAVVEK